METVGTEAVDAVVPTATMSAPGGVKPMLIEGPAYQIAQEHCYSKLGPFRSSTSASFFPTEVLFPNLANHMDVEQKQQDDESEKMEETGNNRVKERREGEGEEGEEEDIDVVGTDVPTYLPYDETKVSLIMMECVKHLNLVKIPPENSDLLLEKILLECGFQQRRLLSTLLRILQGDHLARLTYQQAAHEPIKRRLHNDRAVRQFRKALSDVNWDPKLVVWAHETLIQLLDSDLLPVYLDVLQILKSKCPVLVEQIVHSSLNLVGGEAFSLLLKRPWSPVVGMSSVDRQVHFENPPLFVTLPYSSVGLGGRRWRLWQSQLSSIGKVYPVIMPEVLSEPGHACSLVEFTEITLALSLTRVKELNYQFPTRPIVLLAWTVAGRIAAKIAEVVPIACIVSFGLPERGLHHKWEISSDPFTQCTSPTIFVVGTNGSFSSVNYIEKLRATLKAPNSLVLVGGGDDLLRLSSEDKYSEEVCQSIADRCILEKVYQFMIYNLPSSFPDDTTKVHSRKRKSSHNDDIGGSFLTPAMSHSSIILNPHTNSTTDEWNCNLNNSNAFLKSFLSMRHNSRPGFGSHSPSPIPYNTRGGDSERPPLTKIPIVGELPKIGRPRSKSTADRPKKRVSVHSRSRSIEMSGARPPLTSGPATTLNCIPVATGSTLASNSNNSNSSDNTSPTQLLCVSHAPFRPLPITPPRNPFEDSGRRLNPKTLKQLQRK